MNIFSAQKQNKQKKKRCVSVFISDNDWYLWRLYADVWY